MRITTLRLKNFRSHAETTLELDRFNFIRGPNRCGKSSIRMALEYLFTGRCELTDASGRGAEALIRAGEKELEVSATLEIGETICRRRTPRAHAVEINGRRVPRGAAETYLAEHIGAGEILAVVLHTGRLVELSDAGKKRLITQVCEPGTVRLTEEIGEALRAVQELPLKITSLDEQKAAYQHFCGLRAQAGCALTALGVVDEPNGRSNLSRAGNFPTGFGEPQEHFEGPISSPAGAQAGREAYVERKLNLETRIRLLDHLIEILRPDGRTTEQFSSRLESFQKQLNRLLASFGFECTIALEPFEILVRTSEQQPFRSPWKHLSATERFQFGVGFQVALALVLGMRFAVIDGADVLDREARRRLTKLLMNSDLDQAIVLATGEDTDIPKVPPGVKFLRLGEGIEPCKDAKSSAG